MLLDTKVKDKVFSFIALGDMWVAIYLCSLPKRQGPWVPKIITFLLIPLIFIGWLLISSIYSFILSLTTMRPSPIEATTITLDLRCYGSLWFFYVSTKNKKTFNWLCNFYIEISMKLNFKSCLWEFLTTTEIFSDYSKKIYQIFTECQSCLWDMAKKVVSPITFSLTLWHGA